MAIFLPRRWRHQPQGAVEVDWANPLARDLVFLLAPPITPTTAINAVNGQSVPTSNYTTIVPGVAGVGLKSTSGTTQANFTVPTVPASGVTITAMPFGHGGGWNERWVILGGGTTGIGFVGYSTSTNVYIPFVHIAGVEKKEVNYTGPDVYDGITLTAAFDGTKISKVVDGRFYGNTSVAGSIDADNPTNLNLKWRSGGRFYFLAVHYRNLSADEIAALGGPEKWTLFRAPSHRIFFDLGAAKRIPTLSLPGVIDVTATSARPRVTVTFPT